MKHVYSVLVLLLVLAAVPGFSAELTALQKTDAAAPGPSGSGGVDSRVSLEATDGDAKATARLAGNSLSREQYFRYALTVSAPFDSKKQDHVDIGTLSGLTAGTSVTADVSWRIRPPQSGADEVAIKKVCEEGVPELIKDFKWEVVSVYTAKTCTQGFMTVEEISATIARMNAALEKCKAAPVDPTTGEALPECKALHDYPEKAEATPSMPLLVRVAYDKVDRASLHALHDFWMLNGAVTYNERKFNYVLPSDPTTALKQQRSGAGVTASATYVADTWLTTFGYSHEKSYESGAGTQICSPIGTTGSLSCGDATLGAPDKTATELGFVEARAAFTHRHELIFAIAPRVEYDFKASDWAVRFPFYFVANSAGQLTAGVALGYTHKKDDFGASVFISKPFQFFD